MTKQKKIDYINEINDKFVNARNHGHSGNNWWYPVENTIAYNVKMHKFGSADELRKYLTARQNDFYTDDNLYGQIQDELQQEANNLSDDIDAEYGVKSGYAGRSGGWLEVEYHNPLTEVDDDTALEDINSYYKEAKKLDTLEGTISQRIATRLKDLNDYIETAEYYKELAENCLYSDEDIAEHYKGKIKSLTDKLK